MNNSRFAICLHILILLKYKEGELLTSGYIAGSININPVLVRKEISNLRKHGLIESKEGKNGGNRLAKPADQIHLSEVYHAIRQEAILGHLKTSPNPDCHIGKQINDRLSGLYEEAERAMLQRMGSSTLADFYKQFN